MLLLDILLNLLLLCFCFGDDFLAKFVQNDYKIKDIRTVVNYFDEEYMKELNLKTFKYNRSVAAINLSFAYNIDVKNKQEILIQVYKLLSNEYRVFPIRFQISLTRGYKANLAGIRSANRKCGFFNESYFLKNVPYSICNYVVDDSKLPPLIPAGQYKTEITFLYFNKNIAALCGYGEVYRSIAPPKKKKVH